MPGPPVSTHRVGVGATDPVVPLAHAHLTNPTLSYSAIAAALSVRTSRNTTPPSANSSRPSAGRARSRGPDRPGRRRWCASRTRTVASGPAARCRRNRPARRRRGRRRSGCAWHSSSGRNAAAGHGSSPSNSCASSSAHRSASRDGVSASERRSVIGAPPRSASGLASGRRRYSGTSGAGRHPNPSRPQQTRRRRVHRPQPRAGRTGPHARGSGDRVTVGATSAGALTAGPSTRTPSR